MTLVIPAGNAQVTWRFSLTGDPEPMIITCGTSMQAFTGQEVADAMAQRFMDAVGGTSMSAQYTFLGTKIFAGPAGPGDPASVYEAPMNVPGQAPGGLLPQNCCILIRKLTALAGRHGRGRMYLPPLIYAETDVDSKGMLSNVMQSGMQGVIDEWFAGDFFVLLHDSETGGGLGATPITGFVVDNRIATQRRRLRR